MSKLRVAVLMGGPSSEREVSLRSGQMVLKNLDPTKYAPFAIDLNDLLGRPEAVVDLARRADFVFLALHGAWGEDGTVQGLLEVLGLPYYGPGVTASAIGINKVRTKSVYRDLGIPQARWLDWRRQPDGRWLRGNAPDHVGTALVAVDLAAVATATVAVLGPDVVIKGATQGSTLGLAMAEDEAGVAAGMLAVAAFDDEILVEERIRGMELTAPVIGGDEPLALPLVEIRPQASDVFDYEAKYTPGASLEICPAPIDAALTARVQALARLAHHGLGCWGVSRSDFMVRDGAPYILETNTLPGLTEGSLLPQAARAAGIMLPELLDRQIGWGLARPARRRPATAAPSET
jgi:D-alanine-D-alanine ligase